MLSRIDLHYFKCFRTLKLPLQPLTLLSGANASGKSTLMHALVLLHQTMREHEWSVRLMLNGSTICLGTSTDVIDEEHGYGSCAIQLCDGEDEFFRWEFEGEGNEMSMAVVNTRGSTLNQGSWNVVRNQIHLLRYLLPEKVCDHSLVGRLRQLTYLSAERLGPRESYLFDDPQLTPVVGPQGEYAVSVLHSGGHHHVLQEFSLPDIPSTRIRQVEGWMARFFPGYELVISPVERSNSITLGVRTSRATDFHRPMNSGFGLTQVLPIVVAALSASRGDILLIENPEVHLHPAGQAAIGEFLARAASAGIQVILETHSDHVLNGIRRAVKSGLLTSDEVAIHFFRPRGKESELREAQVVSPTIDSNGDIDSWPTGFFDQFDKDLNYFAGWQ